MARHFRRRKSRGLRRAVGLLALRNRARQQADVGSRAKATSDSLTLAVPGELSKHQVGRRMAGLSLPCRAVGDVRRNYGILYGTVRVSKRTLAQGRK
jgi:hypothetical protein